MTIIYYRPGLIFRKVLLNSLGIVLVLGITAGLLFLDVLLIKTFIEAAQKLGLIFPN